MSEISPTLKDLTLISPKDQQNIINLSLVLFKIVEWHLIPRNVQNTRYALKFAKSSKTMIPRKLYYIGCGMSFGYVGVDIYLKCEDLRDKKTLSKVFNLIIWNISTSIVMPAVTIHTIIKVASKIPKIPAYVPNIIRLLQFIL